jgi:PIN domain nuclease of toxin-antitoxin system
VRILLDTHILYWWLYETARLPDAANDLLAEASQIFVSSATIWEIAIKVRLGRLNANVDEIIDQVSVRDLHPLPVTFAHAKRVANLELHHKDPFDRLLIAQALSEPLHLVTVDEQLKPYSDLIICLNSP